MEVLQLRIVCSEKCYVCGSIADFSIKETAVLYREAQCGICNASLRNSDTAKIVVKTLLNEDAALAEVIDNLQPYNIVEAQASGAIHNILKKLPHYIAFEFLDDTEPGYYRDGVLCNDLENLTFETSSIDLIITQDVMEHVANPDRALSQINRVLKEGGYHIFTVPIHETTNTISRKKLPNVFHGDVLRASGALVITDWGKDINSYIDLFGMETERHDVHCFYPADEITNVDDSYQEYLITEALDYYKYNSIVITSRKIYNHNPQPEVLFKLHDYGPKLIEANCSFNVQANGESAIWARTSHANNSTILVIDDFQLTSHVYDNGELVTAYVPAWLYQYPGEYSVYLYDVKRKVKSNVLTWIVTSSQSSELKEEEAIARLRRENLNLHKQLELHKQKNIVKFSGWGLSTEHELPWKDQYNWHVFRQASEEMKTNFSFGLYEDTGIDASNVDTLLWRHWIVAFAVQFAINNNMERHSKINIVECGVGDGMSAYFALKELEYYSKRTGSMFSAHLYDSWGKIRYEDLHENEKQLAESYSNNSLERVQNNLKAFHSHLYYHVGYIPDTFQSDNEPIESIHFLHIDLNSVTATLAALQHFYPRINKGGVILFDDYGWAGYAETKEVIDTFFSDKKGILQKLPTGQAIYYI